MAGVAVLVATPAGVVVALLVMVVLLLVGAAVLLVGGVLVVPVVQPTIRSVSKMLAMREYTVG